MINKNDTDLSVVIPIYNVEAYLPVCINSLMHQGDLRLEIILVNDGSTDLSGEIVEEYAKKDSRIRVIHQENVGASAARNAGLKLVRGEYIAFVDSDDWVKENGLYELYNEAVRHQTDVVNGKMLFCLQNGRMSNPVLKKNVKEASKIQKPNHLYINKISSLIKNICQKTVKTCKKR